MSNNVVKSGLFALLIVSTIVVSCNGDDGGRGGVQWYSIKGLIGNQGIGLAITKINERQIELTLLSRENQPLILATDINSLLSNRMFGFPKSGALQLSDANGKIIKLSPDESEEWWSPSSFSSAANSNDEPQPEIVQIPANGKLSITFEWPNALMKMLSSYQFKQTGLSAKKWRARIPVRIGAISSNAEIYYVTSAWYDIPIK